jgi:alanyl-tRNA synthetase
MTSKDIREKYINFFTERGHKQIPAAKLVPENDPTTLFTSSGMQPLVPFLLGQEHPEGKKLVDSQPSFRAEDIEEVGDNRHTTFFEMLGNWSLGEYFKKEQLEWNFKFLIEILGLPKDKLHITLYEGSKFVSKDTESFEIWKGLGIPEDRIYFYGDKNWWSRSGAPANMPHGEPGGPDSEVFFEFGDVEHDKKFGEECHPNCDCGRFMEICNSVFIQYKKKEDGALEELKQKNVDFGGGLERLVAAANNQNDIFKNDLHFPLIEKICEDSQIEYGKDEKSTAYLRIIADHIKAATFLIKNGVIPSNKLQGYVLRRLLRRACVKLHQLGCSLELLPKLVDPVMDIYQGSGYFETGEWDGIRQTVSDEVKKFELTLSKGIKEIEKVEKIDGKIAFDLYQTFGFPYEVTEELFRQKGQDIDHEQFKVEFEKHRELSRTASAGMFKGGLADHSEIVTKYHTATHLLHQALRDILGEMVYQKGSNITSERLRFDFSYDKKMTDEEVKQTEELVNKRIEEDLKVDHMIIPLVEAKKMNAIGLFDEKYAENVSIYGIGPSFDLDSKAKDQRKRGGYYSIEFCGGPHVEHTGVIGRVKIVKEEAVSAGVRRIRVQLV